MSGKAKSIFLWSSAAALALVLPVVAQESLLPEGFGDPAPAPTERPAPTPTPAPTPKGGSTGGSSAPASASGGFVSETAGDAAADAADAGDEGAETGILRYDLPPGARRSLARIGPLTPENGGLAANAFGARGAFAARIMRATDAPIASRWASIMLRRALMSAIDTPATVNGADLAAERAALLLRMGEASAARRLVQAVDADRGTPRLAQVAMQVMLANADPAGLCPWTKLGLGRTGDEHSWRLAAGMCAALSSEPGPAGWAVDKVRGSRQLANFDILLAERVLGATLTGRRAITLQWDGVDRLTSWRFGLATATGTPIPPPLRAAAPPEMAAWAVLAPMTPPADRVLLAERAALAGVLSGDAYVSLVAAAAADADAPEAVANIASALRAAYGGASASERFAAMRGLWQAAPDLDRRYAAMVLTARAAAALPVGTDVGDAAPLLIGAMLAGGYDRNALAWVPTVTVGSQAWGLMAVGLPRPLAGVDAGAVDSFAGDDDSDGGLRSQFLVAGLAGLGRLSGSALNRAASEVEAVLTTESRWTRAISDAAARGETGMVALLVATGMQSRDWTKLPPHHLFHMVRALREVGLGSEARMLAAEALVRV
jgi:YD repeat-containing protein